jgi:hypothetical protein
VLVILSVAGCGLGDGKGSLAGSLYLRGCTQQADYGAAGAPAAYDMHPTFFVADAINAPASAQPLHPINKMSVRVQPRGNRRDEADVLYINVASDADVAGALGQAITVGAATNVRATLDLFQTCPSAEVSAGLDGTITWSSFGSADATNGIQFGDHLAATFDFNVVDRRALAIGGVGSVPTTPAAGGHISGSFDFYFRQGKAAQLF